MLFVGCLLLRGVWYYVLLVVVCRCSLLVDVCCLEPGVWCCLLLAGVRRLLPLCVAVVCCLCVCCCGYWLLLVVQCYLRCVVCWLVLVDSLFVVCGRL